MYRTATKRRHARQTLQNDLAKLKDALSDATYGIRGKTGQILANSFDDLKERSANFQNKVSDYAADRPFRTLGIAVLTGLIIGYIIRR